MKLSVIVPVFNEESALPFTISSLRSILAQIRWSYEIILVDDGSTDESVLIALALGEQDERIKVVSLSRNFGHQAAITAGMDFATGDAVIVMDADLQDPPELIPAMIELFEQGNDVVSPQRVSRKSDSVFKRSTATFFYWLLRKGVEARLPPEVGDFRLLGRPVVEALRSCREHHRYMRGLVAWLGFREAFIPFERRARVAGHTKYPLWKMLQLAWTAITSFSALPLRISIVVGLLASASAFAYLFWALYVALVLKNAIRGWTSVIAFQAFSTGIILLGLGLIGEYIAKIYEESKQRPLYVVRQMKNLTVGPDRSEVPASQPLLQHIHR
jgi:glycosyltransferase involved in cell wall biosynthesis